MKLLTILPSLLLFISCANAKDRDYTGSTPAGKEVRLFLGIPLSDSVDFIRWKLTINDRQYSISCNYGIGKPNTNGFYDGGKKIELKGKCVRQNNVFLVENNSRNIRILELNDNLLHFLDENNNLVVGNGGWSYVLNMKGGLAMEKVMPEAKKQITIKDSLVFDGRTPCKIPGFTPPETNCYKLKWRIVLYKDAGDAKPVRYKILGTAFRGYKNATGSVQIVEVNSQLIYILKDPEGNGSLYLQKLDDGVLIFTDASGKLLVGDEDFSYTLNKRI